MPLRFVFRVDSSAVIGSGHVMRCLTLASVLKKYGAACVFVCRDFPGNFSDRITQAGFDLILLQADPSASDDNWLGADQATDANETIDAVRDMAPDWLIVDHYAIDKDWHKQVTQEINGLRILAIDDLADREYQCDILLDLSPGRSSSDYDGLLGDDAKRLVGLEYALLRPEFLNARNERTGPKAVPGNPAEILITFGGADTQSVLQTTIDALATLPTDIAMSLAIIGRPDGLQIPDSLATQIQWIDFEPDMAARISRSDLVVSAAGGTSWERCCLGVPAVVLMIAENQRLNFNAIKDAGAGICIETEASQIAGAVEMILTDKNLYSDISINSWNLCDGRGARRVADALFSSSMTLRDALIEDAQFIYDARYSDGAHRFYKNPEKPEFEAHINWLRRALQNPAYRLLIAQIGNSDIAHVRFDIDAHNSTTVEIGIALAADFRGKSLGVTVIKSAVDYAREAGFTSMTAEVHPQNEASKRVFESAGFRLTENHNDGLLHYQRVL